LLRSRIEVNHPPCPARTDLTSRATSCHARDRVDSLHTQADAILARDRQETELLEAAREGDRKALDELLRRHRPRLLAICQRMCRDAEEASEVLQDTLLGIAANIRRFRGDSSLLTWAYTIARTHRARRRRGRSLEAKVSHMRVDFGTDLEQLAGQQSNPYDRVADDELRGALMMAIRALSLVDREILVRRDVEGFSASEVALQLGLTVPAVKTRLHRARVATRERMASM
jgi:RNA polymerase sigma-70 factor, ECF subfamily